MVNAFLSLVVINQNEEESLLETVDDLFEQLNSITTQFELIIVDNCSSDSSVKILEEISLNDKYKNIQIYALSHSVDMQTAAFAGIENALGDFVCIYNQIPTDQKLMRDLFNNAVNGNDYVYIGSVTQEKGNFPYRALRGLFRLIYRAINRKSIHRNDPPFKVLSKNLINYILRHQEPLIKYKFLNPESIFSSKELSYNAKIISSERKNFYKGIDEGFQLLVSSAEIPMRIVTSLSLLGAIFSIFYSLYVLYVSFTNNNIADGWASISLQLSLMFFLISCVLIILGEYVLKTTRLSNYEPHYLVSKEFTSQTRDVQETLNVESIDVESIDSESM